MLTLNDGRNELWQWDTGRKLTVDADCSQVHFSNKVFGRSIDVDVVDGTAAIPDVLLQVDNELITWAFVGTPENGYTKISKVFKVNKRNKPADYVFTPPEQTTLGQIVKRLDRIEESQDPDAIKNAVDDYLANNPIQIDEKDPTVPAWAKQATKPKYTAAEVGALPDTTEIPVVPDTLPNPKSLTIDQNVGGASQTWVYDGTKAVSFGINIPTVPTMVSALTNDAGYLTEVPEGYAKTTDIPTDEHINALIDTKLEDNPGGGGGSGGMELELIHDLVVEESVNGMNLDMRKDGKPVYWRYLEFVFVGVFDSPTGKTGGADLQIAKGYNGAEWDQWNCKVFGVFNSGTTNTPATLVYQRDKIAESSSMFITTRNHSTSTSNSGLSEQQGVSMTDYEYIRLYFPGNSTDYNIGAGTKIKIWGIRG